MKRGTVKALEIYSALHHLGERFSFGPEALKLGCELIFEPAKAKHTDSQRGYYWRSIKAWGKSLGYSGRETEIHLHPVICCEAWGVKERRTVAGRVIEIPNETSADQKRDEYSYLISTLIRVAAEESGYVIEPPKVAL